MSGYEENFELDSQEEIVADFLVIGGIYPYHDWLENRELPDQHPISAITGLQEALDGTSGAVTAERERAEAVEGNLENLTTESKTNLVSAINEVDSHADTNASNLSNHIADKNNPHEVTKAQVGLGNCDNTSDLTKNNAIATLENKTIDCGVF